MDVYVDSNQSIDVPHCFFAFAIAQIAFIATWKLIIYFDFSMIN